MISRRTFRISKLLGLVSVLLAGAPEAQSAQTYFIDQNVVYPVDGTCSMLAPPGNLPDDTASLETALTSAGWSGKRWVDQNAYPQDFFEHCGYTHAGQISGGLDVSWADAKALTIFSGHGGQNWAIFSNVHNGECTFNLTYHTALGMVDGSQAVVGIFDNCSSLASFRYEVWDDFAWNAMRQELGFSDSATVGTDDPRNFFNATSTKTNANAWYDQFGPGRGMPTILSVSTSGWGDCYYTHNNNKLKANVGNTSLLNGSSISCGGTPGALYFCGTYRTN